MSTRREFLGGLGAAGVAGLVGGRASGQEAAKPAAATTPDVAKAIAFLRSRQEPQGSWSGAREPGITALVVAALLRSKRVGPDDPAIARALGFLEGFMLPKDGKKGSHSVYMMSVGLMAFHEANAGGRYDAVIKQAQDFLRTAQYDEGEGKGRDDPQYGGLGYGEGRSRPDMSNTSFMIEALHDSGVPADDPALQRALIFVSRCQNLKSEFNDQPFADKVNDGGFVYTSGEPAGPPGRGAAKADREQPNGGIRSSGSMTYSGFKSMVYAGLKPDDVRVKAAVGYIRKNYTVDENPGQGKRGLYYYYMVFSRAMSTLGEDPFVDAQGKSHDWKAELAAALADRQQPTGAWTNENDSVMEGDPAIATSFAILALAAK